MNPAERRNSGYWDGYNARQRGRYPQWSKPWIYRGVHPSDKLYGVAFWQGWEGEPHPRTKAEPGTAEFLYWSGEAR